MVARSHPNSTTEALDYRALFESAPSCFLVLAPDFTIVAASEAYLRVTNTTRGAIIGKGVFEVFTDDTDNPTATGVANLDASLCRVLASRRPDTMAVQRFDLPVRGDDGDGFEVRFWSPVNAPVLGPDGTVTYIVHRVEDVTEFVHSQVAAHGDRRRKNRAGSSEDDRTGEDQGDEQRAGDDQDDVASGEIGHAGVRELDIYLRAQEIQAANQRLRRLARSKNDFLSRMSHELRTPMNAVLGFTQLLALDDLTDGQRHAVRHILSGGEHLLALIDEVLDMARAESGMLQLCLAPVSVADAVHAALGMTGPLADQLGVTGFAGDIDPALFVVADRQRLLQVLLNLITNALKYNHRDGQVTVTATGDDETGTAQIAVTDTGPGIREEDFARLFIEFDRLDAAGSGIEGVGLGLALSQSLTDQMEGRIDVASIRGEGSTFSVVLPLAAPPSPVSPPEPRTPRPRVSTWAPAVQQPPAW